MSEIDLKLDELIFRDYLIRNNIKYLPTPRVLVSNPGNVNILCMKEKKITTLTHLTLEDTVPPTDIILRSRDLEIKYIFMSRGDFTEATINADWTVSKYAFNIFLGNEYGKTWVVY